MVEGLLLRYAYAGITTLLRWNKAVPRIRIMSYGTEIFTVVNPIARIRCGIVFKEVAKVWRSQRY